MKRIILAILAALLCLNLASCKSKEERDLERIQKAAEEARKAAEQNEYEKSNSTDTNWRLCLTLCSCGKNKAVKNTESLINTIGQIFVNSVVSVVAAKKA